MEAREAKRDAEMQQITQRLEEGIRTYLTSDHYTRYLNTMSRFHNYSINNILMMSHTSSYTVFCYCSAALHHIAPTEKC